MVISRLHIGILALAALAALPASALADGLAGQTPSPPAVVEQAAAGVTQGAGEETGTAAATLDNVTTASVQQAAPATHRARAPLGRANGRMAAPSRRIEPVFADAPRTAVGKGEAGINSITTTTKGPRAAASHHRRQDATVPRLPPLGERLVRRLSDTAAGVHLPALTLPSVSGTLGAIAGTVLDGVSPLAAVAATLAGPYATYFPLVLPAAVRLVDPAQIAGPSVAPSVAGRADVGSAPGTVAVDGPSDSHRGADPASPGNGPIPGPLPSLAGSAPAGIAAFGLAALLISFVLAVPGRARTLRIPAAAWRPVGFAASLELPG